MRLSNPDGGSGAASGWVGWWDGAGITRGAVAAAEGLATGGAGAVGGCPGVAAAGVSPGRRCGLIGLGLWRAGSGGGATGCTGARSRLIVPGGMASPTGAPHCSQKSPSRSSGLLQKRQSTIPGRAGFSKAFLRASSSTSSISGPRAGRGYSTRRSPRGLITGEGEILSATVERGEGRGRAASGASGAFAAATEVGSLAGIVRPSGAEPTPDASTAGLATGTLSSDDIATSSALPHSRQKRIPSGTLV